MNKMSAFLITFGLMDLWIGIILAIDNVPYLPNLMAVGGGFLLFRGLILSKDMHYHKKQQEGKE